MEEECGEGDEEHASDDDDNGEADESSGEEDDVHDYAVEDCDDANDPFLLAIGGKDKLLVGEEYQKMMLAKGGEQEIVKRSGLDPEPENYRVGKMDP